LIIYARSPSQGAICNVITFIAGTLLAMRRPKDGIASDFTV